MLVRLCLFVGICLSLHVQQKVLVCCGDRSKTVSTSISVCTCDNYSFNGSCDSQNKQQIIHGCGDGCKGFVVNTEPIVSFFEEGEVCDGVL